MLTYIHIFHILSVNLTAFDYRRIILAGDPETWGGSHASARFALTTTLFMQQGTRLTSLLVPAYSGVLIDVTILTSLRLFSSPCYEYGPTKGFPSPMRPASWIGALK